MLEDTHALRAEILRLRAQVASLEDSMPVPYPALSGCVWEWPSIEDRELTISPQLRHLLNLGGSGDTVNVEEAFSHVHPRDLESVHVSIASSLELGGDFINDYRIVTKDGIRWLRTQGRVTKYPDRPASVSGWTVPLREEIQRGQQNKEVEGALAQLLQKVGIRLWETPNIDGSPITFIGFNGAKTTVSSPDLDDVWARHLHADSQELFERAYRTIRSQPAEMNVEVLFRLGAEDYRWHMCRAASTFRADGKLRATGTLVDIHERKLLEEANALTASRLQLVVKGTKAGMYDYPDTTKEDITLHSSYWQLLGYTKAEVSQTAAWSRDLVHPDDVDHIKVDMERAFASGDEFVSEYRMLFKELGYRYIRSSASVTLDHNGPGAHRMTGSIVDIHDRKMAMRQLEDSNTQLERFAYLVAHDLAAPLRQVRAFASIILEDYAQEIGDNVTEMVERMAGSCDNAIYMVSDLLDYARTGTAKLSPKRVDLAALMHELRDTLTVEHAADHLAWDVGELPSVVADEMQMRVLFQNLLANSIKFTRDRPSARLTLRSKAVNANECEILVSDNGVGFDPSYAERIFEAFERAHDVASFAGTGIGLANVARVVARHGGKITAKGEVGKGAEFRIVLPGLVS